MLFGGLFSAYVLLRVGATAWPDGWAIANVPLGVLMVLVVLRWLRGEWAAARGERFDLAGAALFAVLALLAWAVVGWPRAAGRRRAPTWTCGMTPESRAMTRGLTAAINSHTSLDLSVVSGGATTMWDMDPQWIDPARMQAILGAFMAGGGMIFQGNTTSVADLEDALVRPECYPNLIVRVGGYSARFTALNPDLQREIVARRRHGR